MSLIYRRGRWSSGEAKAYLNGAARRSPPASVLRGSPILVVVVDCPEPGWTNRGSQIRCHGFSLTLAKCDDRKSKVTLDIRQCFEFGIVVKISKWKFVLNDV